MWRVRVLCACVARAGVVYAVLAGLRRNVFVMRARSLLLSAAILSIVRRRGSRVVLIERSVFCSAKSPFDTGRCTSAHGTQYTRA